MPQVNRLRLLLSLDDDDRKAFLGCLSPSEAEELRFHWRLWARAEQLPPPGDWQTWLVCAGRGFGKTRAGSEWVRLQAKRNPDARIALVGSSISEVRAVMVEGESGILATSPPRRMPVFEPSLKRISWPNGAQAQLYSAAEPEGLRGPQHSHAWCDEIAKWDIAGGRGIRSWDNLMMGLRLGETPQVMATTTPRAVPLMRRLLDEAADGGVKITRGSTYDNAANLPERFVKEIRRAYGSTALGRQELDGEMIAEVEGALWSRHMLERCRAAGTVEALARVVVGVDPPASARGDECGIIVAGITETGMGVVLADCTVARPTPERWARAVAEAARAWSADRVIAEANQGGEMVGSVLRAADITLPLKLVHASRGKVARAEPVAALYEAGRMRHAGMFAKLEDQLCGLMAGGSYEGPGRSPDRADALVWAAHELMLGRQFAPRVTQI
ncbi:ATP-binding protein [Altererythrobacter confluentis]|uniref:ATP-binding protein n=1 Tax=Allopontixanthobacter confluentis TaxID=1849021 RepID=A0A6L7GGI7_9SPHN|nr:terminase family protein [Allopontixanthobacter confluentis]MXP15029.1 ATP-binding protein [Allopontixanthobacter confluentis]